MHRPQEQVRDFHRANNLRRPDTPEVVWDHLLDTYCDHLLEEYEEFKEGLEQHDILKAIDGLCDLLYVAYGAAVDMGLDLEPFFEEVHRANMDKAWAKKKARHLQELTADDWEQPKHAELYAQLYGSDGYKETDTT